MAEGTKKPQVAGIDDLYGLPLAKFTPARNDLVKRLRSEGEREAADEAGAARKPTVGAWAVNQLVRRETRPVKELLSLGAKLRAAQAKLVRTGDAAGVLALSERERELVRALVERAAAILTESGAKASEATLDEVGETLHAAALDEQAADAVAGGKLTKERRAIGLGLGAGGHAPPQAKPPKKAWPPPRVTKAQGRLEQARSEAREARNAAEAAARALQRAEREARHSARAAEQAGERERRAAEALERAKAKH